MINLRRFFSFLLSVVLFSGFILFSFSPVRVQAASIVCQVVTATATFIPVSATPTLQNFECPVGTPNGWGTYTPSALWLLECSDCDAVAVSTSTLSPSSTPNLTEISVTGTAQYLTGTPTITSTPTITPTVSAGVLSGTWQWWSDIMPPTGSEGLGSGVCAWDDGAKILRCSGDVSISDNNNAKARQLFGVMYVTSSLADGLNYNVVSYSSNASNLYWNYCGDWADASRSLMGVRPISANGTLCFRAVTYNLPVTWTGELTMSFSVEYSLIPSFLTATPTPIVTPTPYFDGGYCSSITPVSDEFGFDLFIDDGEPNCGMGWDEFGVGLDPVTQEYEYSIPAVQICLQPVRFGVIRLFGEEYDVGIYGLVAAAAFFWRYFRTV